MLVPHDPLRLRAPLRVLVADDSDVVRSHLVEMLGRVDGVAVAGAVADTPSTVEAFDQLDPDVVVLDIQMPGGSGLDALAHIMARDEQTHVIMLTNHAHPLYRERCLSAGARHFFDKSTEFQAVETVVRTLRPPDDR